MKKFYDDGIKMLQQVEEGEFELLQIPNTLKKSSWDKERDDAEDDLLKIMEEFESNLQDLKPLAQKIGAIWNRLSKNIDEMEEIGLEDGWLKESDIAV